MIAHNNTGIPDWKGLSWSRKRFYPFIDRSVKLVQQIVVLRTSRNQFHLMLSLRAFCFLLSGVIAGRVLDSRNRNIVLKFFVAMAAFPTVFIFSRYVRTKEETWVRNLSRTRLQKVWAASYANSHSHENTGSNKSPAKYDSRSVLLISTIYLVLSAGVFALMPQYIAAALLEDPGLNTTVLETLYSPTFAPFMNAIFIPFNAFADTGNVGQVLLSATSLNYWYLCVEMVVRDFFLSAIILRAYLSDRRSLHSVIDDGSDLDAAIESGPDPRLSWGNLVAKVVSVARSAFGAILFFITATSLARANSGASYSRFIAMATLFSWVLAVAFVIQACVFLTRLIHDICTRYRYWRRIESHRSRANSNRHDDNGDTVLEDLPFI